MLYNDKKCEFILIDLDGRRSSPDTNELEVRLEI